MKLPDMLELATCLPATLVSLGRGGELMASPSLNDESSELSVIFATTSKDGSWSRLGGDGRVSAMVFLEAFVASGAAFGLFERLRGSSGTLSSASLLGAFVKKLRRLPLRNIFRQ
jgi:hypothetical protein